MSKDQAESGMTPLEYPVAINVKTLLEAGAHFGHQTPKWNPRMTPFIYGARNGVHVINLDITMKQWERARKFIVDISAQGGNVLFVGTKQQAREIVKGEAERCGAYSVTSRWLGGTLSNFQTLKNSINRMKKLEELVGAAEAEGSKYNLSKKEKGRIRKTLDKLSATLGGIRSMKKPADLIFVVDINKEDIAIAEALRLHIPVVALVDTNTDPTKIAFPVAANDDAAKTIRLFAAGVADAILEGKAAYEARVPKESRGNNNDGGDNIPSGKKEHVVNNNTGSTGENSGAVA